MSSSAKRNVIIVGGIDGGAAVASRISRLSKEVHITVIEKSPYVASEVSAFPYFIGGEVSDRSKLIPSSRVLSTSSQVNVFINTEALSINRNEKTLTIRNHQSGMDQILKYDVLLLSPGSSPSVPELEGSPLNHPRVVTLSNLQDFDTLDALLKDYSNKTLAIVGAGFHGVKLAEQLSRINKIVHLINEASTVLNQVADAKVAEFLHTPLVENGIILHLGDALVSFAPRTIGGGVVVTLKSGQQIPVDVIIISSRTIQPENQLAKSSQLVVNSHGYIEVNQFLQTSDPFIYAIGDVVATKDLVFPHDILKESADDTNTDKRLIPTPGNTTSIQARIAADHIVLGKSIPFKGSLGTAIVQVFDAALGVTGWTEERLIAAGILYSTTTVTQYSHASYYPNALPITIKLTFDPMAGRVYGGQVTGIDGVDKRVDIIATAITGNLTVDDLSFTQLCQSAPFGPICDVVNVAGLSARNIKDGLVHPSYNLNSSSSSSSSSIEETKEASSPVSTSIPSSDMKVTLDVRPYIAAQLRPIPNSLNIPYTELPNRLAELNPSTEYVTVCAFGQTACFASRLLINAGFHSSTLVGGLQSFQSEFKALPLTETTIISNYSNGSSNKPLQPSVISNNGGGKKVPLTSIVSLDCSGLACPGPLLKLKEALVALPAGSVLRVTATDPGFANDIKAYASSTGLHLSGLNVIKGVGTALLSKQSSSSLPSSDSNNNNNNTPSTSITSLSTLISYPVVSSNTAEPLAGTSGGGGARKGATIVVFSQELDKVLAALVIANGAAAMDGEVTIFFTFWGLNALRDPKRRASKSKDIIDIAFGLMLPKGKNKLPLTNMNFGGVGAIMMKYVMRKKNLPNLPDLFASAKQQNIRLIACTMSMTAMGIQSSELIDGVELGGVADYLQRAENTGTNLFI